MDESTRAIANAQAFNNRLIAYRGFDQVQLDRKALAQILALLDAGQRVTLIGTKAARPLAKAAGLPWLHEIPDGEPIPQSFAWDPQIAEAGGPLLKQSEEAVVVLGAGFTQWMGTALGIDVDAPTLPKFP